MLLDDIEMKTHRVNELIELLHPAWQEDPDLNLMQFCKNWRRKRASRASCPS